MGGASREGAARTWIVLIMASVLCSSHIAAAGASLRRLCPLCPLNSLSLVSTVSTPGLSAVAFVKPRCDSSCNRNRPRRCKSSEHGSAAPKKRGQKNKQKKKKAGLVRIDKLLAHRGVGTRSATFELAKARRVCWADSDDSTHEERTRIAGPKEKVPLGASLFLDGKLLPGALPLLIAYHKPKFVLSVMRDDIRWKDQARRHLGQVLEPRFLKGGIHPVGRLDYETTGLLLFSTDGKLTQQLLHPRRGVEKEYIATVEGAVDEGELSQTLAEGVETTEGIHTAELVKVTQSADGPSSEVDPSRSDASPQDDEKDDDEYCGPYSDVRLVVKEGKHRMVRRILANCGYPVVELKRLRHGEIRLRELPPGEFRNCSNEEIEWAESLLGR